MLTGINISFIGGDARQLEVIQKCSELDATLTLVGFDQLKIDIPEATKMTISSEAAFNQADVLILPIVGTSNDGIVESVFSNEAIVLKEEHIKRLPEHCIVYTGMADTYLQNICSSCNIELVQLLDRDDVAIYNSIPTVEGALMMTIKNTDMTIHGSRVVVLGLGRVGITLARTFHALGAHVCVGARQSAHLARIHEMGMVAFHIQDIKQNVQDCDVLLNTIPDQVVTAEVIAQMPTHAYIIDLASKPGGVDFRFAERRGIKATLAPGLPGIVAPKTAGKIMANVITQLIYEQINRGRN